MKKAFRKLMLLTTLTVNFLVPVYAEDYIDINNAYMETISTLHSELSYNFKYEDYIRIHSIALYDINKDGINEMFVKVGGCEANYIYFVFTFVNGKVDMLGSFSGGHSSLFEYTGNGVSLYYVNQGYEVLSTISMTDNYQLSLKHESENNNNISDKTIQPSTIIDETVVDL